MEAAKLFPWPKDGAGVLLCNNTYYDDTPKPPPLPAAEPFSLKKSGEQPAWPSGNQKGETLWF